MQREGRSGFSPPPPDLRLGLWVAIHLRLMQGGVRLRVSSVHLGAGLGAKAQTRAEVGGGAGKLQNLFHKIT